MTIIKQLRKQRKISQTALAREIGVSLRTIQHYEKGDIDIPMRKLQKIANFFEVSISDMFKGHNTHETSPKYKLVTVTEDTTEDKFETLPAEELVRHIITHENELMKNKTFRMWVENKAHLRMTELYQDELQKLKKNRN
ncbi:MAG: helix-turn-helix transcriptional regulator [Sinomicrobium sp.]|nr:helix-turn-helix transcriptional regulator [Sinomicrobium sp.]